MTSTNGKSRLSSLEDKLDILMIQLDRNESQLIKLFDEMSKMNIKSIEKEIQKEEPLEPKTITKKPSTKTLKNK